MNYNFASLSHSEFEDLARDLVGREIELRFEAFSDGPDGGMDGRHARANGSIVLQAKHYHGSGFVALKSKMTKERQSIDRLAATRYILVTSAQLTPNNKGALSQIIGPSLQTSGDIFGPGDLNALLRKYPEIEKAHQKLWAQSTAVLERPNENPPDGGHRAGSRMGAKQK
jgi:restriction endonuclease